MNLWIIRAVTKGIPAWKDGTPCDILSVSLDFKECIVKITSSNMSSQTSVCGIYTSCLEAIEPVECVYSIPSAMIFGSKEDANVYVKRLIRPFLELPVGARGRSGIIIARGSYDSEEVEELMDGITEWNKQPDGGKLVLNGDFEFIYVDEVKNVDFKDEVKVEIDNDRLAMVLDDIDD